MAQRTSAGTSGLGGMTASMTPVQWASAIVGVVFLAVGVIGFIPGLTTNIGDLHFVGHESDAKVLGLFQVNILHNIVHLAFGVLGLVAARTAVLSRNFLIVGGVVYLILWLYGLVIDLDSALNFVALNTADNWLHFGLGAGMVLLGIVVPSRDGALSR